MWWEQSIFGGGGEETDRALSIKQLGGLGIAKDVYGRVTVHEEQNSSLETLCPGN